MSYKSNNGDTYFLLSSFIDSINMSLQSNYN